MAANGATEFVVKENMQNLEERKQAVAEKLAKREEERLDNLQKRREEQSNITSEQENVIFFNDNLSKERKILEDELLSCESMPKNKLGDKFDEISLMHRKLQKFVTESAMFLTNHDIRQAQDLMSDLQQKIQDKRDALLPKKKFAFKSKKKEAASSKTVEAVKEEKKSEDDVVLADCKITDKTNQDLQMGEDVNQKDVALARLDSCTVKILGAPSAVHINKLSNCKILSGPVSGSIFIRECVNCVFVVPCQQLRIHTTKDTQFYIHVTSRAIIEDCSSVQFGPYTWKYENIDKHYELSGLDKNRNSWDDIDDFNWLAADKHSPNWSLIPESERLSFE